mgnify:CR=1 FL=1
MRTVPQIMSDPPIRSKAERVLLEETRARLESQVDRIDQMLSEYIEKQTEKSERN